jgi:outer membrane protein TolC
MKKKPPIKGRSVAILLAATLLVLPGVLWAQEPLTLEQCYRLAEKNYPLHAQYDQLLNVNQLKVKNLNKNYLPQINVNGSASLQSEVTQVEIELPKGLPELSMPELAKDWYKVTLDVNQVIYDGNVTGYQKKVEAVSLQVDQKGVDVEIYKLKDRVNQLFFTILLIDQNKKIVESNRERIISKLKEVESAITNGSMLEMNADLLRAEMIRLDQQMSELNHDRSAGYEMLSELLSTPVAETTPLALPEVPLPTEAFENSRPEYQLFDLQRTKTDVMRSMVTTRWNPKFSAYGQGGYGRPGLNMLENDFKGWWLIGARLTWNPWNWNLNKNEKKILSLQSEVLKSQQETFDKNTRMSAVKEFSEINKVAGLLEQDQKIIDLRARITKTSSSQLDNGVITSSDYIARLNEESLARLSLEVHRLQLVKAKLNYLYTLGKL